MDPHPPRRSPAPQPVPRPGTPLRWAVDALRFTLELAALVALAVGGAAVAWPAAVLLPVAMAGLWGAFVAPKAPRRLPDPARLALEVVLFVAAGAVLAASGRVALGAALAIAAVATALANRAWGSLP